MTVSLGAREQHPGPDDHYGDRFPVHRDEPPYIDWSVGRPETRRGRRRLARRGVDDFETALANEREFQDRMTRGGLRDLTLTAGVGASGGLLQVLRDEYMSDPLTHVLSHPDIYTRLAELPVNWTAVAAAAGVVAVKSAAQRIHRANEFARAEGTNDLPALERLVERDRRDRFIKRVGRRLGRAAVTIGFGILAYKGAEHVSPGYSTEAAGATFLMATTGITYARHKTEQAINRHRYGRR